MPYRMYDVCKKKLGVCWGLVDKISPAFELRNSGVPAVAMLACRVPAGLVTLCGQSLRRVPPPASAGGGSTVVLRHPLCASSPAGLVTLGLFVHPSNQSGAGASARLVATEATHSSYLCVAPPGSWVGSTTVAVPRHCRPSPPGQSPAYTYLKQPLRLRV